MERFPDKLRAQAVESVELATQLLAAHAGRPSALAEELRRVLELETAEAMRMEIQRIAGSIPPDSLKAEVTIVTGFVTGRIFHVIADAVEYLQGTGAMSGFMQRLKQIAKDNSAFRTAAARGFKDNDWDEFNTLVDDYYRRVTGSEGGSAGPGGDAPVSDAGDKDGET